MTVIRYGPWAPDQPRFANLCITAKNVYPIANGYGPFPSSSAFSSALAATCVGVISYKRTNGTIEYFAGTATNLYRLSGTTWNLVSKDGGYTSSAFWRFAVYGGRLIATNGTNAVQKFDLSSDSLFSDMIGTPPVHTFPIVIRDTLVALDTSGASQIRWSAVNDSEKWTADCGGGSQPVVDGGPVVGGTGGEFGTVLQESALTRMNFVGGDLRFTFDRIEGAVGCIAPDSIVGYKGRTFYLSDEGFQLFDGAQSENISDDFVSTDFFSKLDYSNVDQVRGALDPANSSVIWRYPISGGGRLIIYNYRVGQWAETDVDTDCLHTGITSSGTILSGFDSADKLARFSGDSLTAQLSTGDIQITEGRTTIVQSVRGLVDAEHTITVAKKKKLSAAEKTKTGSASEDGKVSIGSRGRFHRFQLEPIGTFTEIIGIDVEAVPGGERL